MKTPKFRNKKKHGFTLIEILVVVTIIALLIGILVPVTGKALSNARLNAAMSEINNLRQLTSDAANRIGGTLPLTEGITALSQVRMNDKLTLSGTNTAEKLFNLNGLISLDNVLMGMKPSMMDDYYESTLGLKVVKDRTNPPVLYDSEASQYVAQDIGTRKYKAADGFGDSSRIECALVNSAFTLANTRSGTSNAVNATGGINFLLDGVNSLKAGRCVFMIYENVPMAEAYELSKRLNPDHLLNSRIFTRNAQTKGRVIYNFSSTPTTRVFVYLADF
jgi:prepilin-type N-terminal cleavage/methylation domain-containing protein